MSLPAMILSLVAVASALGAPGQWADVTTDFTAEEESALKGPDGVFEIAPPFEGAWKASFSLANHYANLAGLPISVHSANTIRFCEYNLCSGNGGKSSHLAVHIHLSEPIAGFVWDMGLNGRSFGAKSHFSARYSVDGVEWKEAIVYPNDANDGYDPPPVTIALPAPTQDLYVGWFAEVGEGDNGWWNLGGTGEFTFFRPGESLVVVPTPPAPRPALVGERFIPNTFFGTTTHVNDEGQIRFLNDLNMHAVRVDLAYEGLEPAPGQYNFAEDMWMIRSLALGFEHNLEQLAVLTRPPAWARDARGLFPNDASVARLEEFMYQLALRYKGRIRYWEAMNEPNMAAWKDRFTVFLKAFYGGVKRADPENKVVLCGFAGPEPEQLRAVYRFGGKDFFDIVGSHPYTRPNLPERGGFIERIQALHNVMTEFGDAKPLWITEAGWNGVEPSMLAYLKKSFDGHRTYACSEEDEARGLARLYLISATMPWIERVYFFHLGQEAPYTSVTDNVDAYIGIVSPWMEGQARPKEAYFAVKTVISILNEASFKERIETPEALWALVFTRGEEATVALWKVEDAGAADASILALPAALAIENATSMVGTPVLIENGQVPISGRPIYIKTKANALPALAEAIRAAAVAIR